MNIKRCAFVAAAVLVVCAVAFWYGNRSTVATGKSVATSNVVSQAKASAEQVASAGSALPQPSGQTATVRGTKPYVLTCEGAFTKALRRAAESLGVRTVGVLSANELLIEADGAAVARLSADSRFNVKGEVLPSEKVSPALAALIASGKDPVDVTFVTLSPEDRLIVRERIASSGGELLSGCLNEGDVFSARLPAALVAEFSAQGDVRWMEEFVRPHLMNDVAVDPAAMNVRSAWKSEENPAGLSGAGQIISTSDSGIDTGDPETLHEDLRDRVKDMKASKVDAETECDMFDSNGHGTHTAGSIVGNGMKSEGKIRGTAWGAQLCVWFCGKDGSRSVYTPESCAELFRGDEEGSAWDAYIHSASWGSDEGGKYTAECAKFDEYLWKHPDFLPVVSAGNAGSGKQTVGSPAASKNVLAVGATLNLSKGDASKTADFSSRGPCADGRIKPDIAAPGDPVKSTRSSKVAGEGDYTSMSGTSMSCPLTAGAVALVREWLVDRKGFVKPTAALMKAVITGGAKDAAKPNNEQGWGRVDLMATLAPSDRAVKLIDQIPFADGEEFSWIVETTNAAPLDVQLAWVDYPATASANQTKPKLVNDLDLSVVSLNGAELHYGNGGDSADALNNLESVRLETAAARKYLVTVSCTHVPYDYEEGGAAALYIRGAFDPDEVVEYATVRIVKTPETTNTYSHLDKALADAADGDVVEILEPTSLRRDIVLSNGVSVTIVATNAAPSVSKISRVGDATIRLVGNATLSLSNVVFQTAADTAVIVEKGSALMLSGPVDFGLPSSVAAVRTYGADGLLLASSLDWGFSLDCTVAYGFGDFFGRATCDFLTASNCAARIANWYDRSGDLRGVAVTNDLGEIFLKWDETPVPVGEAAGYFVIGGETNTAATLDRIFEKYAAAIGSGAILADNAIYIRNQPGLQLRKPVTVTSDLKLVGEGVMISDIAGGAGFTVNGGTLSVDGLSFEGYCGNCLFLVNSNCSDHCELLLGKDVYFSDIEGTNSYSGAVAAFKGKVTVNGTTFENCRATGTKNGSAHGGAIYLAGAHCELVLNGGSITGCYAKNYGGGVYAKAKSSVSVRGNLTVSGNSSGNYSSDDIYLVSDKAVFRLIGPLGGGRDCVGVRYGGIVADPFGNAEGNRFVFIENDFDLAKSISSLFNDANPDLEGARDGDFLKWDEPPVDRRVSEAEGVVCVVSGDHSVTGYYALVEHVFEALTNSTKAATVTFVKDVSFANDLSVVGTVELKSAAGGPKTLTNGGTLSRILVSGAGKLTVTNLVFDGGKGTLGLLNVNGGTLTLKAGAKIQNVLCASDRASGAVSVWNDGTFAMESGAEISSCSNGFVNAGTRGGYCGGVLLDHSKAYLTGGTITDCMAVNAAGMFVGNGSKVFISGNVRIEGNENLRSEPCNMLVSDDSELVVDGSFAGSIGYTMGALSATSDPNVFGRVTFSGTDAEIANSARHFRNDVTGDYGQAVRGNGDDVLVWGSAIADGAYKGSPFIDAGTPVAVGVPVAMSGLVYDFTEQVGVPEGVGYTIVTNRAIDAGAYTATATLRAGFAWKPNGDLWATNIPWSIAKTNVNADVDALVFTNCTFVCDGTVKRIDVEGTLPQGVSVSYVGNDRIEPGVYAVTATFAVDEKNFESITNNPRIATLTIVESTPPTPPPGPTPEPEIVHPDPIAFKAITRVSDTKWKLVVTNIVPYCNYRLIWTDDLMKGFVSTGDWVQIVEDAPWTTNVVTTGGAWFWKAEGKDGEKPAE